MKTIKRVKVNHLRIYPSEREVVSSVNKVKGMRAGALILSEMLPNSAGQTPTNALQLSGKQLDNLAGMHGIRTPGRKGWMQLSSLIGVGKSAADISSEEHKKGDKYVVNGVETEYTATSTNNSVDAIILSDYVAKQLVNAVIEDIVGSWDDVAGFDVDDNGAGAPEPPIGG